MRRIWKSWIAVATVAVTVVCCAGPEQTSGPTPSNAASPSQDKQAAAFDKNHPVGQAPPTIDSKTWLNTDDGKPLAWKDLKGKVVLLDLWAYW